MAFRFFETGIGHFLKQLYIKQEHISCEMLNVYYLRLDSHTDHFSPFRGSIPQVSNKYPADPADIREVFMLLSCDPLILDLNYCNIRRIRDSFNSYIYTFL